MISVNLSHQAVLNFEQSSNGLSARMDELTNNLNVLPKTVVDSSPSFEFSCLKFLQSFINNGFVPRCVQRLFHGSLQSFVLGSHLPFCLGTRSEWICGHVCDNCAKFAEMCRSTGCSKLCKVAEMFVKLVQSRGSLQINRVLEIVQSCGNDCENFPMLLK